MSERATHPRLIQCVCGSARHCIIAFGYEPGITAAQAKFGSYDDITLTAENAVAYMRSMVEGLIERKSINPWCELCKAPRERWLFDDRPLPFATLEEAWPFLRQSELDQLQARQFIKASQS